MLLLVILPLDLPNMYLTGSGKGVHCSNNAKIYAILGKVYKIASILESNLWTPQPRVKNEHFLKEFKTNFFLKYQVRLRWGPALRLGHALRPRFTRPLGSEIR